MRYPHITQHDEKDCGAACLCMIAEFYGGKYTIAEIRNLIKDDNQGSNIYGIVSGASNLHLKADAMEGNYDELVDAISKNDIKFPFIVRIINEDNFQHYIVVYNIKNNVLIIGDPAKQGITKKSVETFTSQWQGQIITFEKDIDFTKINKRKGIVKKYFKYLTNQKKNFAIIITVSLILSFISIATSNIFNYILNDSSNYDLSINDYSDSDHDNESEENTTADDNEYFFEKIENQIYAFFDPAIKAITKNIDSISLAIIALVIVGGLLQLIRGYILSIIAKKIEVPLTLDYHKHLINLPLNFFGTRKTGEVMSRFSDTSSIRNAISGATLTIVLDSLMAIIIGVYLFSISITLFLITLVIVALYAVTVIAYRKPIKNINHEILEQDAQVESYLKESIDGIETVKAYQIENKVEEKTETLFVKLINKVVKGSIINVSLDTIVSTVTTIGTVCLFWVGTYLCRGNIIDFGEMFSFYYLLGSFLTPVGNLIDLQPTFQTALVAAERLEDIVSIDTENSSDSDNIDLNGDIELRNVSFRYGFRNLILNNINMTIKKGQKIAIIGESGCGKTTIAKLLMNFYSPESGEIIINGKNINNYSPKAVRNHIAYISQNTFLFSDTIKNNLKYGNENTTDEEIEQICKLCCADKFINEMPLGYNTMLEENGANLSTGQKQRIAIARALLKKPEILIMDEATGNLDTVTEECISKTIDNITKNITCIVIAHRLKTIKNCDDIYVIKDGQIAEHGSHSELIEKKCIYFSYWSE